MLDDIKKTLWATADKLRANMDAAEYKHVVLGLVFLKYISEALRERHAKLFVDKKSDEAPKDPDEDRATGTFWISPEARGGGRRAAA